jgi:hypothetical protein
MLLDSSIFPWATVIVATASAYVVVGCVVAASYLLFLIDETDPASRHSYAFRALIGPGLILFWPFLLYRWLGSPSRIEERASARHVQFHRAIWFLLAVIVPAILICGFLQRSSGGLVPPVQKLSSAGAQP